MSRPTTDLLKFGAYLSMVANTAEYFKTIAIQPAILDENQDRTETRNKANQFEHTVIGELVAGRIIPRAILKRVRGVLHKERDDMLARRRDCVVQSRWHAHLNHGSGKAPRQDMHTRYHGSRTNTSDHLPFSASKYA